MMKAFTGEQLIELYIAHLLQVRKLVANSVAAYAGDIGRFVDFLIRDRNRTVVSAKQVDIEAWLSALTAERVSTRAQRRKLCAVSGFCRFLLAEEHALDDPTKFVPSPGPDVRRKLGPRQVLSVVEIERLLAAPDLNIPRGIRDVAMLQLLLDSGLRVSELVSLESPDVDLEKHQMLVCRRKVSRMIPLSEATCLALANYVQRVRRLWVQKYQSKRFFLTDRGLGMTRQGFWKLVVTYATKAKLKGPLCPQALRHAYAVHFLAKSPDLETAQTVLGYASLDTLQRTYNV